MLIKEDFPTFDLPIKAYSGRFSFGHLKTSVLLMTNSADFIFIIKINSKIAYFYMSYAYSLTIKPDLLTATAIFFLRYVNRKTFGVI